MHRASLLHSSRIPTLHFQRSLPKLPVPKLEDTLRKYLDALSPLVTPTALAHTRSLTAAFAAGEGAALQARLCAWDAAHPDTSYISDMWYAEYLRDRSPLPLNLNPQLTWRDDARASMQAQPARAANIAHAAVRFHLTLEAGALEPDVYHTNAARSKHPVFEWAVSHLAPSGYACYPMYAVGAYPLDMSQHARLFSSTRIPRRGADELHTAAAAPRHIIVARGPRLYSVDVFEPGSRTPISPAELEARIRFVLADAPAPSASAFAAEPPIAALTGAHRDTWADARVALLTGTGGALNAASLSTLDDALFVLTLDGSKPESHEDISRTMLHGDVRSRVFDKSLNIIVASNGRAGVSWEHAWGDGGAVLGFVNHVFSAVEKMSERSPPPPLPAAATATAATLSGVSRLQWDLSHESVAAIRAAEAASDAAVAGMALRVYQTPSLNRDDVKRSGLSPDGVMQAALQLAHWRTHHGGLLPSTYESASTSAYKKGRTETIRSATPAAAAMCLAFAGARGRGEGAAASLEARFAALKSATEVHRGLTLAAVQGLGCDRHLYALAQWGARSDGGGGAPPPALFADPAYALFKDIRLSTSTLASPALDGGGFGPVNNHSYAVGYGVEERGAHFHIASTSKAGGGQDNGVGGAAGGAGQPFEGAIDNDAFAEGVEAALVQIRDVIAANTKGGSVGGGKGARFK